MDLQAQIQSLIDNAPQDGVTPQLMIAIAPVLQAIAQPLRHLQYYILQDMDHHWIVTTLSNRTNSNLEKRVIYAFPTLQDASTNTDAGLDPQVIAAPIPVIHLLFQLMALEPVDNIVFFETPGTMSNAVEIQRHQLQSQIQGFLQTQQKPNLSPIPPDIA